MVQTLTDEQCQKLIDHLRVHAGFGVKLRNSFRNHAIILLMLDAGLRVGELVQLHQSDLYFQGEPVRELTVRSEISKSKTPRTLPLTQRLRQALELLARQVWMNQGHLLDHYAFYATNPDRPLTTRQARRIIFVAGKTALGIDLWPHLLRHTFASRVLKKSNLRITQQLLGHKSINTTQIYTHPDADDRQKAINSLSCE